MEERNIRGVRKKEDGISLMNTVFVREEKCFLYENLSMEMDESNLRRKGKEVQMERERNTNGKMGERSLKRKGKEVRMEMHESRLKRKGKELQTDYKASKKIKG